MVYIFQWWASSNCPRSSWASKLDACPLSFLLRFHTLIALVHLLHGNPYSLASISIDGHLHSPLICLVDVRLSSFCLLLTTSAIFYATYSVISMAHTHVLRESWKSFRTLKVWKQLFGLSSGLCMIKYFVWWRWSIARLYDFVGITFFGHVILRRHDCFISILEVLLFLMLIWTFYFESFGS